MSKGSNKLSFWGAAFTSMGSGLGVALVGMIGFVFAAAGKGSPLIILIGLITGYITAAPWFLLSKKASLKGGNYSIAVENLGPVAAAVCTYSSIPVFLWYTTYPLSFASYVTSVIPALQPYTKWVAIASAVAACIILCKNIKVYERFQNVLTACLMAALLVFVLLGAVFIIRNGVNIFDWSGDPLWTANGLMNGLTVLPMIMGTMAGYVWVVYYGPVTERPTKTLPKAIIAGGVVVSFFWIALSIVGVNVLPVEQVAGQPLTVVAGALMPPWMVVAFVILGPAFTILTSYIGLLQGPVSQISKAAEEGWLPKILAQKSKDGRSTPLYIGITAVIVIAVLTGVSVGAVATFAVLIEQVGILMVGFAFFTMPKKHPELFTGPGDVMKFRIAAVGGIAISVLTAYLALRTVNIPLVVGNLIALAAMTVFGYVWYKKGRVNIENNFEIELETEAEAEPAA